MIASKSHINPATSITHQHIVAIINTNIYSKNVLQGVRILDMGCGDGKLLCHMLDALPILQPDVDFDVFGLDVVDAGQQDEGYMNKTTHFLSEQHPEVGWEDRLALITTQEKFPFSDNTFDYMTSNQVMEHVMDHDFVFREIHRCLSPGGLSINLFPVREVLWEGHALMPLVHRIKNEQRRARLMLFFAKVGFRRHYYREMPRRGWKSLEEFASTFAHVLETDTNYLTVQQLREAAGRAALEISFTYTKDYFVAKLLSYIGYRPYVYSALGLVDSFAFLVTRYFSSVTVLLKKAA